MVNLINIRTVKAINKMHLNCSRKYVYWSCNEEKLKIGSPDTWSYVKLKVLYIQQNVKRLKYSLIQKNSGALQVKRKKIERRRRKEHGKEDKEHGREEKQHGGEEKEHHET